PRADALPRGTRGHMAAMDPAPVVPGVARHPAVDAMPLDSPALRRNDKAGAQDALALRSVAPAIQPSPHDQSTIGPPPAQRAREPAPLPRSMPEQLAAPLSATTVALLATAMAPTAPPAIHISIARIEVRAPAQPAKQPPPRPRVAPEPQSVNVRLRRYPWPWVRRSPSVRSARCIANCSTTPRAPTTRRRRPPRTPTARSRRTRSP